MPFEGVPKGKVEGPLVMSSNVYPGTQRTDRVYAPAQDQASKPAALMVFQDGHAFLQHNGEIRATNGMDNLIYRREIPVMIGVFINPGPAPGQKGPSGTRGMGDGFTNRGVECNALDDKYARVITEELLSELKKEATRSAPTPKCGELAVPARARSPDPHRSERYG